MSNSEDLARRGLEALRAAKQRQEADERARHPEFYARLDKDKARPLHEKLAQQIERGRIGTEVKALAEVNNLIGFIAKAGIFGEDELQPMQLVLRNIIKAGGEPHEIEFLEAALLFLEKCELES